MAPRRTDAVLAVALVVCWSSGFVGAELGARAAAPVTVLAWRFALCAVLLLPALLVLRPRWTRRDLAQQAVLALLCQVAYVLLVVEAAAAGTSAGTSALIGSLQPLLVGAVAVRLLGERPTRRQLAALAVGVAGVAVVVSGDLRSAPLSAAAVVLPVAAVLALSAGSVLDQLLRPSQPVVTTLAVQCALSAAVLTAVAAATGDLAPPATSQFWTAVLWSALPAGLGGYGAYYAVVRRSGAARVSALLLLTPATTALWARAVLDQPMTATTWAGLAISAVAARLVLGGRRPRSDESRAAEPSTPGTTSDDAGGRRDDPAADRRARHPLRDGRDRDPVGDR